jgi:hypothetical protein
MTRTTKKTTTTSRRSCANQMRTSDEAVTGRRPSEGKMDEKFIVVWTIDGETTRMPHSTQDAALHQAEKLFREHGCDLEIHRATPHSRAPNSSSSRLKISRLDAGAVGS